MEPYKRKKENGKNWLEYRYLYQKATGMPLKRFEFLHHINGDKHDNRLSNLLAVTPKEHMRLHNRQKHPLTKKCAVCNMEFMPHPTKRLRAKTCSRKCFKVYQSIKLRNPTAPNSMYRPEAYPCQKKNRVIVPAVAVEIMKAIKEADKSI